MAVSPILHHDHDAAHQAHQPHGLQRVHPIYKPHEGCNGDALEPPHECLVTHLLVRPPVQEYGNPQLDGSPELGAVELELGEYHLGGGMGCCSRVVVGNRAQVMHDAVERGAVQFGHEADGQNNCQARTGQKDEAIGDHAFPAMASPLVAQPHDDGQQGH